MLQHRSHNELATTNSTLAAGRRTQCTSHTQHPQLTHATHATQVYGKPSWRGAAVGPLRRTRLSPPKRTLSQTLAPQRILPPSIPPPAFRAGPKAALRTQAARPHLTPPAVRPARLAAWPQWRHTARSVRERSWALFRRTRIDSCG